MEGGASKFNTCLHKAARFLACKSRECIHLIIHESKHANKCNPSAGSNDKNPEFYRNGRKISCATTFAFHKIWAENQGNVTEQEYLSLTTFSVILVVCPQVLFPMLLACVVISIPASQLRSETQLQRATAMKWDGRDLNSTSHRALILWAKPSVGTEGD